MVLAPMPPSNFPTLTVVPSSKFVSWVKAINLCAASKLAFIPFVYSLPACEAFPFISKKNVPTPFRPVTTSPFFPAAS